MRCDDAVELITGLVDNEVSTQERAAIEAHLSECETCALSYEQERELKLQIRLAAGQAVAPEALRRSLERELTDLQPRRIKRPASFLPRWVAMPALRPVFAVALVIVIFAPLYYLLRPAHDIALEALATHQEINTSQKYQSSPPIADMTALKTELVAAVGGEFEPMGFDLSMMQLYPVAGFVRKINNRDVIVTVYQGKGPGITCFTFLGTEADAPGGALSFHDPGKKINFYSFSSNGTNGVMHREGNVICIMVSEMPAGDLLALVRAKARHA
jgi:hypothetical protein